MHNCPILFAEEQRLSDLTRKETVQVQVFIPINEGGGQRKLKTLRCISNIIDSRNNDLQ